MVAARVRERVWGGASVVVVAGAREQLAGTIKRAACIYSGARRTGVGQSSCWSVLWKTRVGVVWVLTSEWRWMQLQSVVVARGDARRVGACWLLGDRWAGIRAARLSLRAFEGFHSKASRSNERQGRGKETGENGGEVGGERARGGGMQRAGKDLFRSFP
ncbi:hypothetical protein FB567DRAFT_17384 [Paraphoma chrysanthemicola]|uniref:Uncharacterized protein n=1 Tax=Paraphoma chrysanthemicola TaxID=798071 RepID=A0A8K0RKR3_9PLEO|nr:hypothetical protein FB567DRAFT_17384 [Paraphoma chrysanthemicola]